MSRADDFQPLSARTTTLAALKGVPSTRELRAGCVWLSKLCFFWFLKYLRDPNRDHNFDNHPYVEAVAVALF